MKSSIRKIWSGLKGDIIIIHPTISKVLVDSHIDYIKNIWKDFTPDKENIIRESFDILIRNESFFFSGDANATVLVRHVLAILYGHDKIKVEYDSCEFEKIKNHNLVLIGGPIGNRITKVVWEKLKEAGNLEIFSKENGWSSPTVSSDKPYGRVWENDFISVDHGVCIKKISPYNKDKYVFIFAGWGSYGTQAAAAALDIDGLADKIIEKCDSNSFELIVKIQAQKDENLRQTHMHGKISVVEPFETELFENYAAVSQSLKKLSQERYCSLVIPLRSPLQA